jgi:subtilisin family serine protease
MLINSAIPGNDYLQVSGTSQAAPFVANVAAKIKEANLKLKPLEIKKILMGTVDKKGFLSEKVLTGGIVNLERAVVAAQMTNSMSVTEAISRSLVQVQDAPANFKSRVNAQSVMPMPLSPMFK